MTIAIAKATVNEVDELLQQLDHERLRAIYLIPQDEPGVQEFVIRTNKREVVLILHHAKGLEGLVKIAQQQCIGVRVVRLAVDADQDYFDLTLGNAFWIRTVNQ